MKKLINIAAVLLAASMIFVGCSNGVAAPGSNNGGSGSGNGGSGSAGAEEKPKDVVLTPDENGNIALVSALEEYLEKYDTITFKIKNEGTDDRSGWGVLKLMPTDAEDPFKWHDGILSENQFGQLPGPDSFNAGDEYSYEFSLSSVVDALKTEATTKSCTKKHQLTAQPTNDAVLKSVVVSKK